MHAAATNVPADAPPAADEPEHEPVVRTGDVDAEMKAAALIEPATDPNAPVPTPMMPADTRDKFVSIVEAGRATVFDVNP